MLGRCVAVFGRRLERTQLTGSLPSELGRLTKLTKLYSFLLYMVLSVLVMYIDDKMC